MWKRLNNQKGTRQPAPLEQIPHGGYVEDEYTGPAMSRSPPPDASRPPPQPARGGMSPGLLRPPVGNSAPPPSQHRDPRFRPASSVYSQPSPHHSRFGSSSYANPYDNPEEVSPPSSPVVRSQNPEDDEVSPIDEMPDISKLNFGKQSTSRPGSSSKGPSSNIPVLRREKRRNQAAAAAQNLVTRKEIGDGTKGRTALDPRWDPYSGEITTSDEGKPQSVKPGQFAIPGLRLTHKPTPLSTNLDATPKPNSSFSERVRKMKNYNAPAEKPEWKGATGRVTLVSPVADQLDIPPISIPRKSSKRVASPVSGPATPVSVIRYGALETVPAAAEPEPLSPTIRSVLTNSGRNSPRVFSPDSVAPAAAAAAISNNNSQARGNLPTEVHVHQKKDSAGTIERNFREAFKDISFNPNQDTHSYVEPPSRFSVTTYAPSEAQSSTRPSIDDGNRPSMPTPPQSYTTDKQLTPVVNRRRPKVAESPKVTARKAVNNGPPVFISMSTAASVSSKRSSNIAKNLPQSPPEAEAQSLDLISALQAQLDNLAHRRNNIQRGIRQMTELMPKDNVTAPESVKRKRAAEKLKVEGLREEEADIRQQEHELGLKLHRAWKRKDKEAEYEPTGLWVRRVTG